MKLQRRIHKTDLFQISKEIYEVDLQNWERAYIVDKTNSNLKTAWIFKVHDVGCCNHKFKLKMKNLIEIKIIGNSLHNIKNTIIQT